MIGNLKTSQKIAVLIITGLIALCTVGYIGIAGMAKLDQAVNKMYTEDVEGIKVSNAMLEEFLQIRVELRNLLITADAAGMNEVTKRLDAFEQGFIGEMNAYEKIIAGDADRKLHGDIKKAWGEFKPLLESGKQLALTNQSAAFLALSNGEMAVKAAALMDLTTQLAEMNDTLAAEARDRCAKAYRGARNSSLTVILIGAILSAFIGLQISQAIVRPLTKGLGLAKAIAAGDMTQRLDYASKDEIGQLAAALNSAVGGLRNLVANVHDAVSTIGSASQQLAATSEEMAAGSQNQAEEITRANQTVGEFAASIEEVAASAQEIAAKAEESVKVAQNGGQSVEKAIAGMDTIQTAVAELGGHSAQIGEIITVIDDIASQTNLLALNAAIEAARAGEHGRGFAVVADEVRKLAERSGQATKEIASLIAAIQKGTARAVQATDEGAGIIRETGEVLKTVMEGAQGAAAMIEEVSAGTEEQAASAGEVAKTMETIAKVTEEVSAGTEETSASTQELARMAEELSKLVAQFKI